MGNDLYRGSIGADGNVIRVASRVGRIQRGEMGDCG
jgi:hypothetical protein